MDKKPMEKKEARLRRARRARAHILELRAFRLTVHRTPSHIYNALGVAAAAARLMRLDVEQTTTALVHACNHHAPRSHHRRPDLLFS